MVSMVITLHPQLEAELIVQAAQEGIAVEDYVAELISSRLAAQDELNLLLEEAERSGPPIEGDQAFWDQMRQRVDKRRAIAIVG